MKNAASKENRRKAQNFGDLLDAFPVIGPIAQRLEQGTHNPIETFPSFVAVCVSGLESEDVGKIFF